MLPDVIKIVESGSITDVAGSYAFVVLEQAEISQVDGSLQNYVGKVFPAGLTIFFTAKTITLSAGVIVAYIKR